MVAVTKHNKRNPLWLHVYINEQYYQVHFELFEEYHELYFGFFGSPILPVENAIDSHVVFVDRKSG